jgi:hypothetical protein
MSYQPITYEVFYFCDSDNLTSFRDICGSDGILTKELCIKFYDDFRWADIAFKLLSEEDYKLWLNREEEKFLNHVTWDSKEKARMEAFINIYFKGKMSLVDKIVNSIHK